MACQDGDISGSASRGLIMDGGGYYPPDAGTGPDSGSQDASPAPDSPSPDAGAGPDSGPPDAGTDASPQDAGTDGPPQDASPPQDATPDAQDCKTCYCAYGPCVYDSDCPGETTCQDDGTCETDAGAEVDNEFEDRCEDWVNDDAPTDCTTAEVIPIPADGGYDPQGCDEVYYVEEGHSGPSQCTGCIDRAWESCVLGCTEVTGCVNGCSTFEDGDAAQNYFDTCMQNAQGQGYTVSLTANQSLNGGCERTTHLTLSCEAGSYGDGGTVTYEPCDWSKKCYFVGTTQECTSGGGVVTAVCCPDGPNGGSPEWEQGTSCSNTIDCGDVRGDSCWGASSTSTTTTECTDNGAVETLECCTNVGPAGWIDLGTWQDDCPEPPAECEAE